MMNYMVPSELVHWTMLLETGVEQCSREGYHVCAQMRILFFLLTPLIALLSVSCSSEPPIVIVNPEQARLVRSALAFRHDSSRMDDLSIPTPREHAEFVAQPYYPLTYREWKNAELMGQATADNTSLLIERGKQRGKLFVNGKVAMDFPVSTGRASHRTPLGDFRITEKRRRHISNIYHVSMPCFMRLTDGGIGLHVGEVYRSPVSHGCIRLTRTACEPIFRLARVGTKVCIVE